MTHCFVVQLIKFVWHGLAKWARTRTYNTIRCRCQWKYLFISDECKQLSLDLGHTTARLAKKWLRSKYWDTNYPISVSIETNDRNITSLNRDGACFGWNNFHNTRNSPTATILNRESNRCRSNSFIVRTLCFHDRDYRVTSCFLLLYCNLANAFECNSFEANCVRYGMARAYAHIRIRTRRFITTLLLSLTMATNRNKNNNKKSKRNY